MTRPDNSVTTMVAILTGMFPSISNTTNEIRKVIATMAAPENLVFLNPNKTPPIN